MHLPKFKYHLNQTMISLIHFLIHFAPIQVKFNINVTFLVRLKNLYLFT